KPGAIRQAPDALFAVCTNRVENDNTLGPQSHGVGPCSEGWLQLEKSALQSTRSTAGCPALRGCPSLLILSSVGDSKPPLAWEARAQAMRRASARPAVTHDAHDVAQCLSYSSWRRHQTPVSLRPLGVRSSHWYMPQRPSRPRA